MMFVRATRALGVISFITLLTLVFFIGSQRLVSAEAGDIPTDPLPNACSDGIDNDGDGLMDFVPIFGDPGCDDIFDSSETGGSGGGGVPSVPSITECSDGIDNDGDGLIDFVPVLGDPGCDSISDPSETGSGGGDGGGGGEGGGGGSSTACSDGLDNDGDGKVDSADPGCSGSSDTDETDPTGGSNPDPGTGGGGPAAACEDSIDNDGDSLVDMADPGCGGPSDNDESSGGSGGGGGGGGGGSGSATVAATSTGEILGTSTTTAATLSCDSYLTAFIKFGSKNNDVDQVTRLQKVLKDFEGAALEENGNYDSATLKAVHAFQTKYANEILTPWGIQQSTGYVYLTTRKKVNEIRCENKATFPLTPEELKKIDDARTGGIATEVVAKLTPSPAKVVAKKEEPTKPGEKKTTPDTKKATTSNSGETVRSSGLKKAWDFLGRLLNLGR